MSDARTWEDFRAKCDDLIERAGNLPDRAEDFASSVTNKLSKMQEWAEEHEHVTESMWTAADNIEGGIARWER